MKLGFIGTGKISSSVITGICGSSIKYSKIYISSRNRKIAKGLKKKFKKITIEKNNQKVKLEELNRLCMSPYQSRIDYPLYAKLTDFSQTFPFVPLNF